MKPPVVSGVAAFYSSDISGLGWVSSVRNTTFLIDAPDAIFDIFLSMLSSELMRRCFREVCVDALLFRVLFICCFCFPPISCNLTSLLFGVCWELNCRSGMLTGSLNKNPSRLCAFMLFFCYFFYNSSLALWLSRIVLSSFSICYSYIVRFIWSNGSVTVLVPWFIVCISFIKYW